MSKLISSKLYFITSAKTYQDESQCDCSDCDCACSVDIRSLTSRGDFLTSSKRLTPAHDLRVQEIDPQNILVMGRSVPPSVISKAGYELFKMFPANAGDVILKCASHWEVDEVEEIIQKMVAHGLLLDATYGSAFTQPDGSTTLTSWLHLTDRCNLRCAYCYLPHVREDMTPETAHAALEATFRSAQAHGFKKVKLKYAGGEPLLQYPLMLELHHEAMELSRQYGIALEEIVLSNGTLLTQEKARQMKADGLHLMISLDGLGHFHDAHRAYAGGKGSFEDVAQAIETALAAGLVPNISVTISSRSAHGLPDLMKWILAHELPFSLNFYRENTLSASQVDLRLDEQKIIDGMLQAFKVIEEELPQNPFLGGIIDRANLTAGHIRTCGVGQNYMVFDQHGQVGKCQMSMHVPVTTAAAQDPLSALRADRSGLINLSVEEKEGCQACEWRYWCTGGCPLATHRATGRYDVKSPNCEIYKSLYPEALRLEALRLLRNSQLL